MGWKEVAGSIPGSGGSGSVTNIATGTGLTGGPITTTGTISIGTTGVTAGTYGNGSNVVQVVINSLGQITSASNIATGTGSVTSIVAGTGLIGGTITNTGTVAIGTSGVSAGTYQGLVVNTLGQVTSATNQSYGTGSVTSITTNNGLTGGPITTTGTIGLATIASNTILGNILGSAAVPIAQTQLILGTGGFTGTSNTIIGQTTGSVNNFLQLSIQNLSAGGSASTDFVVTANDGNDNIHYVDLGMNGSGGGTTPFTAAHASYLYTVDNELDIAVLGTAGVLNFYTTGGTAAPVKALSIGSTQICAFTNSPSISTFSSIGIVSNNTGGSLVSNAIGSSLSLTSGTFSLNVANSNAWTAQQYFPTVALTPGTAVSWNLSTAQNASLAPVQNFTLNNPTNLQAGASYSLIVTQDSTGTRVITWGTAYKFPGGAKFVLSVAANSVDIITFLSDGTYMYSVGQPAFS